MVYVIDSSESRGPSGHNSIVDEVDKRNASQGSTDLGHPNNERLHRTPKTVFFQWEGFSNIPTLEVSTACDPLIDLQSFLTDDEVLINFVCSV